MISSHSINWIGVATLYKKEVSRFLKVYNQTLLAPIVNAMLLLAIFSLAMSNHVTHVEGVPFQVFMASGLIMMSVVQQAFANTSSSFIMGKVIGTIIDFLMPPITAGEMIFSMVMAGITRGIIVGIMITASIAIFVDISIYNIWIMLVFIVLASMMLSLLGLVAGIFSDSFDQMAAITSYIITPLAFLSGTFYSVKQLPEFWYHVCHYNPFFYMIDGFRYGMTGYSDGSISVGIATLSASVVVLWLVVYYLLAKGYRIKT